MDPPCITGPTYDVAISEETEEAQNELHEDEDEHMRFKGHSPKQARARKSREYGHKANSNDLHATDIDFGADYGNEVQVRPSVDHH